MEEALIQIVEAIRRGDALDDHAIDLMLRAQNKKAHDPSRAVAKKRLLPFYLAERERGTELYRSLAMDDATHDALVSALRAKPRRTASGVATVTVLMKPWPCGSDCLYCPNDVRMPKSYLSDEPACQRAERCFFDPYLQAASRMRVLADMGHNTEKVELIVLGGTFSDYPAGYRTWFVRELFRALNDMGKHPDGEGRSRRMGNSADAECEARRALYEAAGMASDADELAGRAAADQALVDAGEATYNECVMRRDASRELTFQECAMGDVEREHLRNEGAAHRVVGLVVETRPDAVTREHLTELRRLGCTKVQVGLQSLTPSVLEANARGAGLPRIERTFALLREFGFKSHVHYMANLLGATPAGDLADFRTLVSDPRFMPDEVKLYPCALVRSSRLMRCYEAGEWRPYSEEELVALLVECVLAAPQHTRISRMVRDISSTDIVAGNKKTNLRQVVEEAVRGTGRPVREMRMREIATADVSPGDLRMEEVRYATSNTEEAFLQWVDNAGRLAAFLRLSLPHGKGHAMIREVHVYGRVSKLHEAKEGAQHAGLGRMLVERACKIAKADGRESVKVISSVGTREYYRSLGFHDAGLYQERSL